MWLCHPWPVPDFDMQMPADTENRVPHLDNELRRWNHKAELHFRPARMLPAIPACLPHLPCIAPRAALV